MFRTRAQPGNVAAMLPDNHRDDQDRENQQRKLRSQKWPTAEHSNHDISHRKGSRSHHRCDADVSRCLKDREPHENADRYRGCKVWKHAENCASAGGYALPTLKAQKAANIGPPTAANPPSSQST